jgi:TatA/E family protein of Tat protein translocase
MFGTGELLIIFLVALLLFGSKKIPELARGLGAGLREFKKAAAGLEELDGAPLPKKPPEQGCDLEISGKVEEKREHE